MATNIPKFTSFRPKPKAAAEAPKEREEQEKSKKLEVSRASRTSDKKKNDGPSKQQNSTASEDRSRKLKDERRSHDNDAQPSDLFFSDRRGDPDIVRYGSINRYEVPAYRNYGNGCIIGLPSDRRIDRELSTDKKIVVLPARRRRQERLLASRKAEKKGSRSVRFIKTENQTPEVGADFISFSAKRKRRPEDHTSDDENDYRGFKNEDSAKPLDSDAEYESDVLVSFTDEAVTQRNSELVRKTQEHATNVQAWLELAHHQEAMMKVDRPSIALSASDKAHLADVRISIYEQALKKINETDSVVKLYVELMCEARRAWTADKQTVKWTELLAKFPRDEGLWMQYLDFVQTCFTNFKYEECRVIFSRCLYTITKGSSQIGVQFQLYIVVRWTLMIQQAGYQELAIATWQALLEFHMMRPGSLKHEKAFRSFEGFWESEEPRIGEVDAKGWRAFNVEEPTPLSSDADPLRAREPSDSLFQDFCKRELDSTIKLRHPGRTMDEVGEDDAFHTILYSDVEGFLRILPHEIPKAMLLSAFLRFCQLPGTLETTPSSKQGTSDQFLLSQFRKPREREEFASFPQSLVRYSYCPCESFEMSSDLLIDRGFPESLDNVDAALIQRVLKLIAFDDANETAVGEYLLAFEARYFHAEASKTAKKLLKASSSSLRLYNAYGLVESRFGNSAKADQVFSAALSMHKGGTPHSDPSIFDLLANWTWEALRHGDFNEALWRLVSPNGRVSKTTATHQEPDQGALLRSRSALTDARERALIGNDYITAVKTTSLLALLAYVSSRNSPKAALAVHRTQLSFFAKRGLSTSPAAELHAQSIARLLTHHAVHAQIYQPALIRDALEPLMASFPDNTIILSLYATNESRFSIDDRVRAIMHQNALSSGETRTIVAWAFAIHFESLKGEIAGSTSHSIRALYKKAEDDSGAHCPALWKQHVLFELEEANKEKAKRPTKRPRRDGKKRKEESRVEEAYRRVKETFFKGMTQLPWCKDYMMMAFTHLSEEFLSEEELRKVYNVMVEKELRLYVELEDTA
jgi:hypothetical protein